MQAVCQSVVQGSLAGAKLQSRQGFQAFSQVQQYDTRFRATAFCRRAAAQDLGSLMVCPVSIAGPARRSWEFWVRGDWSSLMEAMGMVSSISGPKASTGGAAWVCHGWLPLVMKAERQAGEMEMGSRPKMIARGWSIGDNQRTRAKCHHKEISS
jgi:hypothetical protein